MGKRLIIGLIKGLLVGGLLAVLLVKGLGVASFGAILAYVLAVVTGVLTGLVAGKPIWQRGAKIEAGLKAAVGAFIAAAVMYALRKWMPGSLDLSVYGLGSGALGELPVVTLPVIATALALLYEVDNTGDEAEADSAQPSKQQRSRVAELEGDDEDALEAELEAEDAERRARRKR